MPFDQENISGTLIPETEKMYSESRKFRCLCCKSEYTLGTLEHMCPVCDAAGYYEEIET